MPDRLTDLDRLDRLDRLTDLDAYVANGYPWDVWDWQRSQAPVCRVDAQRGYPSYWSITRYDDIRFVGAHPELFSSTGVIRFDTADGSRRLSDYIRRRATRNGWDTSAPHDMLFTDRPEHLDLRGITARQFTPRAVTRMIEQIQREAVAIVDGFLARARAVAPEPVDLVEHLSAALPLTALCFLLGVPLEDGRRIHRWSDQLVLGPDPDDPELRPGESATEYMRRLGQEYHTYRQERIAIARDNNPDAEGADLLTLLAHATIGGEPLRDDQLHGYIELLVGGGLETTRNAITGGVVALVDNPDQLALWLNQPDMVDTAVEEILRWVSPVIQFSRTVRHEVELGGETLHDGDIVVLWYPAGNRDPAQFTDPYRFDITRSPNAHVTFGHGEHFCLGANLARVELRAMFAALVPHLSNVRIAGSPERVANLHVGAVKRLPVRLAPRTTSTH